MSNMLIYRLLKLIRNLNEEALRAWADENNTFCVFATLQTRIQPMLKEGWITGMVINFTSQSSK